jgi:hypothetical protein
MALIGDKSSLGPIDHREAISGGTVAGIQDLRG